MLLVAGLRETALGRQVIVHLFGPPAVTMAETHERKPDGPSVDHSRFNAVLKRVITETGMVDYEALRRDPSKLNAYIEQLKTVPLDQLGRDEKLATLMNAYNAFTLKLILNHWPLESIRDIDDPWGGPEWQLGDHRWTLDEIEHGRIRPHFKEPRIHFAVNCASIGCPPLRAEAYTADRLEQQLQAQTERVHTNGTRWFRYDADANRLELTSLYSWYAGDFEQAAGSVVKYVARFHEPLRRALEAGRQPEVAYLDWSWRLNRKGALADEDAP